jgi:transcriptional regulator with XRE-family HTH domain
MEDVAHDPEPMDYEVILEETSDRINSLKTAKGKNKRTLTQIAGVVHEASGEPLDIGLIFNIQLKKREKFTPDQLLMVHKIICAPQEDGGAATSEGKGRARKTSPEEAAWIRDIGARIGDRMDELNLGINDLSRLAGINKLYLSGMLSGVKGYRPSVIMYARLIETLNVSLDWLIFGVGQSKEPNVLAMAEMINDLPSRDRAIIKGVIRELKKAADKST